MVSNNLKITHIIEVVAIVHHKIVNIHHYFDGNGCASRLLMNIFLMMAGYPLTIILKNDRKKYDEVLQKAEKCLR